MITKGRGSTSLAGAASLKYRMPAIRDRFPFLDIAQRVERQPEKLLDAGSSPAIRSWCCLEQHLQSSQ